MAANRLAELNSKSTKEKRSGYKHSPLGWIPEEWEIKKLDEIVSKPIVYGIIQAGPFIKDGIPYIKSSDVGGDIQANQLSRTSLTIALKYKRSEVNPGDIVFSLRGNIGEMSIIPNTLPVANLTQGTARISVDKGVSPQYIYYVLKSPAIIKKINHEAKGSTFKEISLERLRTIIIPIPKLKEQLRISSILSSLDTAINKTKQLIEQLRWRNKGLMQGMLTGKKRLPEFTGNWKQIPLSKAAKITKGKALSSSGLIAGDIPVIAGGKSSPYFHNQFTDENVITISASGAYAGFVAYHNSKIWASDCSTVKGIPNIASTKYLYYLLSFHQNAIYKLQTGGAQPHVYPKDLSRLHFTLPICEEQCRIVDTLDIAFNEEYLNTKALLQLEIEKKGLMQKLFTGEIKAIN